MSREDLTLASGVSSFMIWNQFKPLPYRFMIVRISAQSRPRPRLAKALWTMRFSADQVVIVPMFPARPSVGRRFPPQ